jgi:magnesium and cobalt transporter
MGDTDGSSNAAQRAQGLESTNVNQGPGLWGRLFGKRQANSLTVIANTSPAAAPVSGRGMIDLRRLRVDDVAIPSADIVAVPASIPKDDLVQLFRDSGMSRIPVYDGTMDTPLGFVHLKDFALMHGFNDTHQGFDLAAMLRPLLFVPPSMPLGILMAKMQTERRHMALVIDEYGGVDGLLTIEDLIEQVVGEIEDEHDTDEAATWIQEKPGCYVALAKTPLEDFEHEIGASLTHHEDVDEEEIETLGGLVFMLSGRVPARGEVVVHPDGIEFEVVEADPRRIKRLRVRLVGNDK